MTTFNPYWDDSSDEENEEYICNSDFDKINVGNGINWSLFMQKLGIRLLISAPVRKLYFETKKSILNMDSKLDEKNENAICETFCQVFSKCYSQTENDEDLKNKI
jgi:hypothetical protein